MEWAESRIVACLAIGLFEGVPGHDLGRCGDAGHERPASPLATLATEDGCLRPHGPGGPSQEVVLHRAKPEERWDQTTVGITRRFHFGRDLEPVDQPGERCAIDLRDHHEWATVASGVADKPDLIADHPAIVSAVRCSLLSGGLSRGLAWHAEVDWHASGGGVDLVDFGFGASEADAQALDFTEPALSLGFGDAVEEVVADLQKPTALGRVGA